METIPMEMRGPISRAADEAVEDITGERYHQCHKQAAVASILVNTFLEGDCSAPFSANTLVVNLKEWNKYTPMPIGFWGFKSTSGAIPEKGIEHTFVVCWKSKPFEIIDVSLFQYKFYFQMKYGMSWEWDKAYCWKEIDRIPKAYQPFYEVDHPTTARILSSLSAERDEIMEMVRLSMGKLGRDEEPFWPLWWDEAALDAAIASSDPWPVQADLPG